jgi:predicted DNA-binding transcriptional regulator YafY
LRADRLIATLLMLQQRGRLTAAQIAGEIEVSTRTVIRDLEALDRAGIPILSTRGPQGGYELYEDIRARFAGLTASEVRSMSPWSRSDAAGLFAPSSLSALETQRSQAQSDDRSLDADSFLHDPVPLDHSALAHTLGLLSTAIRGRRVIKAAHPDWHHQPVPLYPLALVDKAGTWFLIADRDGARHVHTVEPLDTLTTTARRFHRPTDFHLATFWRDWLSRQAAT